MYRILETTRQVLPLRAPKTEDLDFKLASIWSQALSSYSDEIVKKAFALAIKTMEHFPVIKDIIGICDGRHQSSEDDGRELAARIEGAITKFGSYNFKDAKEYLGPIAWEVVTLNGGWQEVCNVTYDNIPSALKKWRELGTLLSKKYIQDQRLNLEAKNRTKLESAKVLRAS